MARNVAILHKVALHGCCKWNPALSPRVALHSLHGHLLLRCRQNPGTLWKQPSVIFLVTHTCKKQNPTHTQSLMFLAGWCAKDTEQVARKYPRISRWCGVSGGWATELNNVCGKGASEFHSFYVCVYVFSITSMKQSGGDELLNETSDKLIFHLWCEAAFST